MCVFRRFACGAAWALVLVIVLGTSVGTLAQEVSGSISGTVTDTTGAVVKGSVVTLTNTDRGQNVRTVTTNSSGYYTATSLPLGTYTLKFVTPGFNTSSVTNLVLHKDSTGEYRYKVTVIRANGEQNRDPDWRPPETTSILFPALQE